MKKAIGLLELKSIAKGIEAADGMTKAGDVEMLFCGTACPGKFLVLIGGQVGAVQSAMNTGRLMATEWLMDDMLIPNVHQSVFPAISSTTNVENAKSIGVIETFTVSSAILAGDKAAKTANVELAEIRLAKGMGGKSFVLLAGEVSAVKSAVKAGVELIKDKGVLVTHVVISGPDKSVLNHIL